MKMLILLLTVSVSSLNAQITVAAASSMQNALKEIQAVFAKETGKTFNTVYGSSGKLMAQIKSGAPFDVFMSADMAFPESLAVAKLTDGMPVVYARGTLVLWTVKNIDITDYHKALIDSSCAKITIADPRTAPYGRAAVTFLRNEKIFDGIEKKLVYGDNVSQSAQYILTGAVDMGITAKSLVIGPEVAGKGHWIELPSGVYPPVDHGLVLLTNKEQHCSKVGTEFAAFVLSARGQDIIEKNGLIRVIENARHE